MATAGKIHSFESFGTVDGPGIRFVVFLQGCPFRCLYCHNPDTWPVEGGHKYTVEEVMQKIRRYLPYMKNSAGGVTVSGGEPLMQTDFAAALFKACKSENIHTALDTNGYIPAGSDSLGWDNTGTPEALLQHTDLVLLDIKHMDREQHKKLTGFSNRYPLDFARYLSRRNIPVWLRYVVVPGLTDDAAGLKKLSGFIKSMPNIEKVELLPFHKMGEYKWKELQRTYRLHSIPEATEQDIARVWKSLAICNRLTQVNEQY